MHIPAGCTVIAIMPITDYWIVALENDEVMRPWLVRADYRIFTRGVCADHETAYLQAHVVACDPEDGHMVTANDHYFHVGVFRGACLSDALAAAEPFLQDARDEFRQERERKLQSAPSTPSAN